VQAGAQVARVDPPHAHGGLLGGQHGAQLLERGLRRAVAAPALVRLDGGVGGDVRDGAAVLGQHRQAQLEQGERGDEVDLEGAAERVEREVPQPGQRRGAERAGVVHEQLQPADLPGRLDEGVAVVGVCDVARDGDGRRAERGGRGGEGVGVAPVDDDVPAVLDEGGGEGEAEALRPAGDDRGGCHGRGR
jgi:hypothetical protein